MKSPTAAIAEDEPHLREELREQLGALWPELQLVGEAEDGIEALRLLGARAPDILFLDIQMPGLTGLEVAAQANGRCHVVFVTAYDQHAIAAFEQGAVDYLLKPFSAARLATAIARLKERISSAPANLGGLLKTLAAQAPGA
jgi:DNA-binding LytR/AlgR family response regulator